MIAKERTVMTAIKILCVENHPEYMGPLKYMLESAGYDVMTATTGQQALKLVRAHPILGVLLDYELPDGNCTAVRVEMKRLKPEIPVLLFSGVGGQTPFLLRFSDSYLRSPERPEAVFEELDRAS